jgi:3-dehydroquinate synthase
VIPSGEASKTLQQAGRLSRWLAHNNFDRHCRIVSVGGGVTSDLAGFVAATYLRGVPVIHVPTTLLAQVDAAIGGKTGVDIPEGKNLVGAFHQPHLVYIDHKTLKSLPSRHLRNGLAEVIKCAAISDAGLMDILGKEMDAILKGVSDKLPSIIARCVEIKVRIVERDAREKKGLRQLLNFGHSIGHAIEAAAGYKDYLHGEAISIGMFAAAFISTSITGMEPVDRIRLGTLLTKAGLPLTARKRITRDKILEHLARDKKSRDGSVRFVLLEKLGRAVSGCEVTPEILDVALQAVNL